jgi:bacteriocin-like protein
MKIINVKELQKIKGGLTIACGPPPDPPPNSVQWLPPDPDNPTANTPTVASPN